MNVLVLGGIFFGISATAFFAFFSFWGSVNRRATARVNTLADQLDRAGIRTGSQEIVLSVTAGIAILWISTVFLLKTSFLVSLLLLPAFVAAGAFGFYMFVRIRIARRLHAFIEQLETALRLIASSLRVGLGIRQALAQVVDELLEPAQYEFRRVIAQTNLGASVFDAIDSMSARMPANETLMLARVFRVQAETGGDLSRILEQLADTIKGRRQVFRKINSLTAEGRMSAWVLLAIPVGLGLFIVATQQEMGHALLYTWIGHGVLLTILILEAIGYFWVRKILAVEV